MQTTHNKGGMSRRAPCSDSGARARFNATTISVDKSWRMAGKIIFNSRFGPYDLHVFHAAAFCYLFLWAFKRQVVRISLSSQYIAHTVECALRGDKEGWTWIIKAPFFLFLASYFISISKARRDIKINSTKKLAGKMSTDWKWRITKHDNVWSVKNKQESARLKITQRSTATSTKIVWLLRRSPVMTLRYTKPGLSRRAALISITLCICLFCHAKKTSSLLQTSVSGQIVWATEARKGFSES